MRAWFFDLRNQEDCHCWWSVMASTGIYCVVVLVFMRRCRNNVDAHTKRYYLICNWSEITSDVLSSTANHFDNDITDQPKSLSYSSGKINHLKRWRPSIHGTNKVFHRINRTNLYSTELCSRSLMKMRWNSIYRVCRNDAVSTSRHSNRSALKYYVLSYRGLQKACATPKRDQVYYI